MSVAVLILNWNGKEDTLECLASLDRQTYRNIHPIVVDNGSVDDSCRAIREAYPAITLIENHANLGFAEGNNVGIRFALEHNYAFIFLLNNDTSIDPHCIEAFVQFSQKHPQAILGARLCQYHDRTKLDHLGGYWNPNTLNFDLIAQGDEAFLPQYDSPITCDFVCGAAFFAPRDLFIAVGLLESRFFLIWEESDLCARAQKAGFDSIYCPKAIVYHKVSHSFVGGKPHTYYFWWRNRLLWIQRNLPKDERKRAFYRILIPEIAHILKLYLIKSLSIPFSQSPVQRRKQCKLYRAALRGIWDYTRQKFGPGPEWITK
ncbi:MAG: glycosyltransferase family 2 protein [Simkaniaceae bacterium]|nr:glycosyltransferase family 2 protein [Simkaniaceae bacterium]